MVDTKSVKTAVDMRGLVRDDLGEPATHGGKSWLWRCPFHNEQHGHSLAVWLDGWHCFGACQESGDAISWMEKYHKMTFVEAVKALGGDPTKPIQRPSRPETPHPPPAADPPDDQWQRAAYQVSLDARDILWSGEGKRALDYLKAQRGLDDATIWTARLGYIPGHYTEWVKWYGLNCPAGITIPWFAERITWAVKVRRAGGEYKYQQIAGGKIAAGMYWAHQIEPGDRPLLLCEGEFNCLAAWQCADDLISVASVGTSGQRLAQRWIELLATVPHIYAVYDSDDAGDKGYAYLSKLSSRIERVYMPEGVKDLNELLLTGLEHLSTWLAALTQQTQSATA